MNYLKFFIKLSFIFLILFYVDCQDSATIVPKPNYDTITSEKLVKSIRNAKFNEKFNEMKDQIISQIEGTSNLDESVSFISHLIVNSNFSNEEKGIFFQELVDAAAQTNENK
uniref:Mlp lipoprotein family protein n=1 Tax=Strongyloides stercoralis TaxID=6248 RepID=A0A0K0ESX9_STRER